MNSILDRVAAERRSAFHPTTPIEYFALRLALRLGEPETARYFALLTSEYGIDRMTWVYQRVNASITKGENLGRRFQQELKASYVSETYTPSTILAGIRVERRSIGAVIFHDLRIESVRVRQLPSNAAKSESSAAGFINQLVQDHPFESAAVEAVSQEENQRVGVTKSVCHQLRENSISLWELNGKTVTAAFGYPPLNTRTELRKTIETMWPQMRLNHGQACALDAAALGLFIQTERLFNHF
jgi:hypothetical protein